MRSFDHGSCPNPPQAEQTHLNSMTLPMLTPWNLPSPVSHLDVVDFACSSESGGQAPAQRRCTAKAKGGMAHLYDDAVEVMEDDFASQVALPLFGPRCRGHPSGRSPAQAASVARCLLPKLPAPHLPGRGVRRLAVGGSTALGDFSQVWRPRQ